MMRTLAVLSAVVALIVVPSALEAQCNASWALNVSYGVGAKVSYSARNYTCAQSHTSQAGWEPPNVPALWTDNGACSGGTATPPPPTATPTSGGTATPPPSATPTNATPTPTSGGGGVVTLYQHSNYGGWVASFGVGSFDVAAMQAAGALNDDASSVRVAAGYSVTFYENSGFGGASITKTADDSALSDDGWNDRISSLRVQAGTPPPTATPTRTSTPTATPTTGTLPPPPATWQEHWFEHVQLLSLVSYNDTVALYFDDDVNRSAQNWMMPYLTNMWNYARATYGNLNQTRLFSIHHEGKYFGGHPAYWYDAGHDNRNVSDVGGSNWTTPQYEVVTHETAHIVESVAHGRRGSPAFGLWGDSKWAEIYIYDVYVALGMTTEAQNVYNRWINTQDGFPRAGTFWFRDWFYPIWRDHGRAQVLARFFQLLGQYYPVGANGHFSRNMNMGEFVHFWSGAARVNLKARATTAFGWPANYETEFNNARAQFPQITY